MIRSVYISVLLRMSQCFMQPHCDMQDCISTCFGTKKQCCPCIALSLCMLVSRSEQAYAVPLTLVGSFVTRAGLVNIHACWNQDKDGNLLMVLPDQPWKHFLADVSCVVVSCN